MNRRIWVFSALLVSTALFSAGCSDPETVAGVATGRVIGRVETSGGVPLGSCDVLLEGMPLGGACDASGQFDIKRVAPGRRDLRLIQDREAEGAAVTARRIAAAVNPGMITDVGAVHVGVPGAIGGRVKLAGGAMPFAVISVPLFGVVTAPNDGGGYLLQQVPPGTHEVVLTSDGGDVSVAGIEVASGKTTSGVDFELAKLDKGIVSVIGRAIREGKGDDEHGGLAVELVELLDGAVVQSTTTAADGSFELAAQKGVYQLRVRDGENPAVSNVPFLVVRGQQPVAISYVIVVPAEGGDLDGDGVADAEDDDLDGDGVVDEDDAFPYDPAETADVDGDGLGDRADLKSKGGAWIDNQVPTPDSDGDGLFDFEDNCTALVNVGQQDSDGDGVGDPCDNCPFVPNPDQRDVIGDGVGDACRVCIEGEACTPENPCNRGRLSCTDNGPVCADVGLPAANGKPCGAGAVCNNGVCGACVSGQSCPLASCTVGIISCTSGVAICTDTALPAADGTACDVGRVCKDGQCVACDQGAACVPATPCRQGTLACGTGVPLCVATAQLVPDGTPCGTSGESVCQGGNCVPCAEGASCSPPGEPCHQGTLSCSSGTPICLDSGLDAADGTPCGGGTYCQGGACTTLTHQLQVVSGDAQSGYAGATLQPVVLELTDGGGGALVGEAVVFAAPPGGSVAPTSAVTDGAGRVTVTPKLGPAIGPQTFTAQASSAPPASIDATATAPPSGSSRTEVNTSHASGDSGVPGPAVDARIGKASGIAVAADGTFYFADNTGHRVRVVRPDGIIENIAGTGAGGFSGDFGPAAAAKLYWPATVALDEGANKLYIADSSNDRVRVVDLAQQVPTIRTYAGGGSAPGPGYGDGGLAAAASLSQPARLSFGPDGALYIADAGHHRIRRVDPATQVITTLFAAGGCGGGDVVGVHSCGDGRCAMAWNAQGALFIAAQLCGSGPGGGNVQGIVRRDADGTLHHVAGRHVGVAADGSEARATSVEPVRLALDSAGNLLMAEGGRHKVRRIDGRSGIVSTVAGTGQPGAAAEFADAASAPLANPRAIAFDGDDLLIADSDNYSIRRVPGADIAAPTAVALSIDSGDGQQLPPAQLTPQPLAVTLTSAGSALAGVEVRWVPGEVAAGLTASSAITAADGRAQVAARPGIAAGTYTVAAHFDDIHGAPVAGSPAQFTLQAEAPAAETIFTAVNVDRQPGGGAGPEPATLAEIDRPLGLVVASDGTAYLSSANHQVRALTPRGALEVIAGTGGGGFSGDSGPALLARLYWPAGLALDEGRQRLYVADRSNDRVRAIDLASGVITTYAGGGSAGPPAYGDGGPADQARLAAPYHLAVDAAGVLYIGDEGHVAIRRVDPQTRVITTLLARGSCTAGPQIALGSCNPTCGVLDDGAGALLVSGAICGTLAGTAGSGTTPGVLRVDTSSGAVSHLAGHATGSDTEGTAAAMFHFNAARGMARAGDEIYLSQTHRVMRFDHNGGAVHTAAGTGSAGFGGDYGPGTAALLDTVNALSATPDGHLLIADGHNYALRMLW